MTYKQYFFPLTTKFCPPPVLPIVHVLSNTADTVVGSFFYHIVYPSLYIKMILMLNDN